MLKFDEATARLLDDAYQGSDVSKRRLANLDAVAPRAGEHVLDIGCGTGLLALELARAVGDTGKVIGVEPSPDMLDKASARCHGRANVRIVEGTANALPLEDGAVDKAVSIQVFEYLDDIPGALAEAGRVLRPEGRLVIGDVHWDSLIWHSEDRARMRRLIESWDGHLTERAVPALLPSLLSQAGFVVEAILPVTCCDATLRPDGIGQLLLQLVEAYATSDPAVDQAEIRAWTAEQHRLAEEGRFFFALTHYITTARRAC